MQIVESEYIALTNLLYDWATWQHSFRERIGYDSKSAGFGSSGLSSFEDMCEQSDNATMMAGGEAGAKIAFAALFSRIGGTGVFVLIIVSCYGVLNGLMMANVRGFYSLAVRGKGYNPKMFSQVDPVTNISRRDVFIADTRWMNESNGSLDGKLIFRDATDVVILENDLETFDLGGNDFEWRLWFRQADL